MTREEIKDFLDVNSKKDVIEYISNLEFELSKAQKGLDAMRTMMLDMIPRSRYNDLLKRYNELTKKRGIK